MRLWFSCGCALLFVTVSGASSAPIPAGPTPGAPRAPRPIVSKVAPAPTPNVLIAALRNDDRVQLDSNGRLRARAASVREALGRFGLSRYERIGSAGGRGGRYVRLTSDRADLDVRAAARELMATGAFRAVSPDVVLELSVVPNDPYIDPFYQWSVESAFGGNLPTAWDLGQGNASTVIAVMDNGFDITHPDLASKLWVNAGESPGNGLDDDDNGYVDDVNGWDFGFGDNDPSSHAMIDSASGIDLGFHGSFVAGIAAAATNNAVGIAGSGWSCRFMPLKLGNAAGKMTLEAAAEAFGYVTDQGAAVLNMSFGVKDTIAAPMFQALVDDATAAGIVCVAAAGNDGLELRSYPAACQNVLAVGATDEFNARASFSNWGSWVDVAAPGGGMWSLICQNYVLDFNNQIIYLLFFGWDGENPYMYGDGTSFASPFVAGVCGLLRAKSPALTPAEVMAHIVHTGDLVPYDHPIGPRINAFRALNEPVVAVEPRGEAAEASLGAWPNPFVATTTIGFTLPRAGAVRLRIYDLHGREVRNLIAATLPSGRHAALWDGRGTDGRPLGSGVYFAVLEQGGTRGAKRIVLAR